MKKIDTLSSLEGRALLRNIFKELRYEKQISALATLGICWKICVHEKEIHRYVKKDVTLLHTLGFFAGTILWMEEIVNRFYFSTINSFVYFGAALLLVLIGVRRFSDYVDENLVIGGIIFEALMLLFMFVVMIFSPPDEAIDEEGESKAEDGALLREVGEIGRDFAAVVLQLEELSNNLGRIAQRQNDLLDSVANVAEKTASAVAPNPEMIESMKQTNEALSDFRESVDKLNRSALALQKEEIESAVRKEIERIIVGRLENG